MGKRMAECVGKTVVVAAVLSALLSLGCAGAKPTEPPLTPAAPQPPKVEPQPAPPPVAPAPQPQETVKLEKLEQPPPQPPPQPMFFFLDPLVPDDAKLIQSRLAELGLYKAAVDGNWGKGSRAALRVFKKKNLLANPDEWDKEAQTALFQGTGRTDLTFGAEAVNPLAKKTALLNVESAKDAKTIQKRLSELGFYKGAIDGAWGKGSRGALRSFKKSQGLGDSDSWDEETQGALLGPGR